MPGITYSPTTIQEFGAPGTLFENATKNLSRATKGLTKTVNTYEGGLNAEQQRRATTLQTEIDALRNAEDYKRAADSLGSIEAIRNAGITNPTLIQNLMEGYRQQEQDIFNADQQAIKNLNTLQLNQIQSNKNSLALSNFDNELAQQKLEGQNLTNQFEAAKQLKLNQADTRAMVGVSNYLGGLSDDDITKLSTDPNAISGLAKQYGVGNSSLINEQISNIINKRQEQSITNEKGNTLKSKALAEQVRNLIRDPRLGLTIPEGKTTDATFSDFMNRKVNFNNFMNQVNYLPLTDADKNKLKTDFEEQLGINDSTEAALLLNAFPTDVKNNIDQVAYMESGNSLGLSNDVLLGAINSYKLTRGITAREDRAKQLQSMRDRLSQLRQEELTPAKLPGILDKLFKETSFWFGDASPAAAKWINNAIVNHKISVVDAFNIAVSGGRKISNNIFSEDEGDFNKTDADIALQSFLDQQNTNNLRGNVNNSITSHPSYGQ